MWVARDEDNSLALYSELPIRINVCWFDRFIFQKKNHWRGKFITYLREDMEMFIDLTWNDEPKQVYVGIFDREHIETLFQKCGIVPSEDLLKWMEEYVGSKG